jgi:hypothetical protein
MSCGFADTEISPKVMDSAHTSAQVSKHGWKEGQEERDLEDIPKGLLWAKALRRWIVHGGDQTPMEEEKQASVQPVSTSLKNIHIRLCCYCCLFHSFEHSRKCWNPGFCGVFFT